MSRAERIREESTPGIAPAIAPATEAGWRRIRQPGESELESHSDELQRRADVRTPLSLRVQRSSIDPLRDPVTRELFYDVADDDETTNLSRRGLCIRCERPPEIGARMLVQLRLPGEDPVDVVGLARWSRVTFVPGQHGARAVALVGLELLGGAPRALERYGRAIGRIARAAASADAVDAESAVASPVDRR
jgi:hypothetical protein